MARKLYYRILDNGQNRLSDAQWDEILRLQHWYNSEFIWTAGRLAFKMYAVFPDIDSTIFDEEELWQRIVERRRELIRSGATENEIVLTLESEGLVVLKRGGYFDNCVASGFTRVAGNEFNAYLVCEFMLKASLIAPDATITINDEGEFIKPKEITLSRGCVTLPLKDQSRLPYYRSMIQNRHVFAIVDTAKYDQFPLYETTIANFNQLTADEKRTVLRDWSWLGFENNYDLNGDDIQGFDLNKKVVGFELDKHP